MNLHIEEIDNIIEEKGLVSLSDNNYHYKELNVLDFVSVKKSNCNRSFKKFHAIKNVWDLINCNKDLKLFTAYLFYFRPFINNPLQESTSIDGQYLSTYFQTEADWFYSSFVSCCYEKLYNYWDRIGDALAYYLNIKIKEDQVSFPKVIEILSNDTSIKDKVPFKKLAEFRTGAFNEFNTQRKDIVHYYQFETTYRFEHALHSGDAIKTSELWERKNSMPDYFSSHLKYSCEGYRNAYELINNLP